MHYGSLWRDIQILTSTWGKPWNITMTSLWPQWRLKSPVSRLFTQPFIQTHIKENIKAPRHWPLCGEFTGTGEFPAQRASHAENASIWWRHHERSRPAARPCHQLMANQATSSTPSTQYGTIPSHYPNQFDLLPTESCDIWVAFAWILKMSIPGLYLKFTYLKPQPHLPGDNELTCHALGKCVEDWFHDDVIKWKHFPRYWLFVRSIHRSPVNSPHKGQWLGALISSLICASING